MQHVINMNTTQREYDAHLICMAFPRLWLNNYFILLGIPFEDDLFSSFSVWRGNGDFMK